MRETARNEDKGVSTKSEKLCCRNGMAVNTRLGRAYTGFLLDCSPKTQIQANALVEAERLR
jgi:hypothetical protein